MKYYEIRSGKEVMFFWPLYREKESEVMFFVSGTPFPTLTLSLSPCKLLEYLNECKKRQGVTFKIMFTEDN